MPSVGAGNTDSLEHIVKRHLLAGFQPYLAAAHVVGMLTDRDKIVQVYLPRFQCLKGQQQRRVPPEQQRCPCFGGVRRLRAARRSQMQPQRQHRAALQDIRLPALLRAVTRPLQRRLRLSEPPL